MSTAQFTLSGRENRELIALCLAESGVLDPYLKGGRILFKGSATVSCLTRRLTGVPLRICGRITANGMKGPLRPSEGAHFLLYQGGEVSKVDGSAGEVLKTFGPGDLFVTGANALDAFGHAALLIGSPGGGGYGECMGALYTEGFRTLILSSAAKLIPGDLTRLYSQVSRRSCDFSCGMACSLAPVPGGGHHRDPGPGPLRRGGGPDLCQRGPHPGGGRPGHPGQRGAGPGGEGAGPDGAGQIPAGHPHGRGGQRGGVFLPLLRLRPPSVLPLRGKTEDIS